MSNEESYEVTGSMDRMTPQQMRAALRGLLGHLNADGINAAHARIRGLQVDVKLLLMEKRLYLNELRIALRTANWTEEQHANAATGLPRLEAGESIAVAH